MKQNLGDLIAAALGLSLIAATWLGINGYFGQTKPYHLGRFKMPGFSQKEPKSESKPESIPTKSLEEKVEPFDVLFEAQMRLGEEKTYPVEGNKYQISLYENVDPGMTVQIVYCFDESANKIRDLRIPRIRVGSEAALDRNLFFKVKEHFETTELTSHDDRVHQGSIKFQLGRYRK